MCACAHPLGHTHRSPRRHHHHHHTIEIPRADAARRACVSAICACEHIHTHGGMAVAARAITLASDRRRMRSGTHLPRERARRGRENPFNSRRRWSPALACAVPRTRICDIEAMRMGGGGDEPLHVFPLDARFVQFSVHLTVTQSQSHTDCTSHNTLCIHTHTHIASFV